MRSIPDEDGFSLIEVIVSLAMFTVGYAGLLSLGILVGERNALAQERAAATLIAQTRLERLKLSGYSALVDTGTTDGTYGPLDAQGAPSPSGKYQVRWDIQNDTPEAGTKRVLVVTSWVSAHDRRQQVVLDTLVTEDVR